MMHRIKSLFSILLITTISFPLQAQRNQFPDVLDLRTEVLKPRAITASVFSDLGAWHAYALPSKPENYGSFIGPLLMDMDGKWLSNSFSQLELSSDSGIIDLGSSTASLHYYPGMLVQQFETKDFKVTIQLIFVSNREAMIRTSVTNLSGSKKWISPKYKGAAFNRDISVRNTANSVSVHFNKLQQLFTLRLPANIDWQITTHDSAYLVIGQRISIGKGATTSWERMEAFILLHKKQPHHHSLISILHFKKMNNVGMVI